MKWLFLLVVAWASGLANAERLSCRFEPNGRPATYLEYDTAKRTLFITAGYDDPTCLATNGRYADFSGNRVRGTRPTVLAHSCRRDYMDIKIMTGLPPYEGRGFTLVAFEDVPVVSLRLTFNAKLAREPFAQEDTFPYEATFGNFPGNPDAPDALVPTLGVCWSETLPPRPRFHDGGDN